MTLDFIMILFLFFLSYCLYIVAIIPYQEKKRHEIKQLDVYLKNLQDTKNALSEKMSINNLK